MTHEFDIELFGVEEITDALVDRIYEAGCDDATICQRDERVTLSFARDGATFGRARQSAIADLRRAGFDATFRRQG